MRRKRTRRKKKSGWLTTIIVEGLAVLAFIAVYHSNRQIADAHGQQQPESLQPHSYTVTAPSLLDQPHPTVVPSARERVARNRDFFPIDQSLSTNGFDRGDSRWTPKTNAYGW